jgi:hypothetical protein
MRAFFKEKDAIKADEIAARNFVLSGRTIRSGQRSYGAMGLSRRGP